MPNLTFQRNIVEFKEAFLILNSGYNFNQGLNGTRHFDSLPKGYPTRGCSLSNARRAAECA